MIIRCTVLLTAIIIIILSTVLTASHARNPSRDLPRSSSRPWDARPAVQRGDTTWRTTTRRQQKLKKPLPHRERKPNIVVVITDDQDVELGSMNFMPKTLRILQDEGVRFPNAFVTTPMCCPSRSSLLTGMYVHNHNVFTNNDNCSSQYWQLNHEIRSFATYLNNAGYRTGYFGKYLNEYNGTYIPPGWREWAGLIRNSRFYNYTINRNGNKVKHGDDYQKDYYPDLITNDSLTFLRQSKDLFPNKPVMMVLSYPSPHGPEDAAPQFQHLFLNETCHRTQNWNYAPNADKQWILKHTGKMEPIHIKFTDMLNTKRLQTLQTVDEAVEKVYNELKSLDELDNTYILYLSDHGYHLGQFGLVKGKAMPFEFDVKVPFFIRGPKVPRGINISNIVLNLDVAPTLLDIAGVEIPEHMDGKSVLKLLIDANELQMAGRRLSDSDPKRRKSWRDTFLIESAGRRTLGDKRNVLAHSSVNRSHFPNYGQGYISQDTALTKDQRLSVLCQRPEYKSPCQLAQKWECSHDGHRWRIHKCRPTDTHHKRHRNNCICPENTVLDPAEKSAQQAFLRDHVSNKQFKPRFIGGRQQRSVLVSKAEGEKETETTATTEIEDKGNEKGGDDDDDESLESREDFDHQEVYQLFDIIHAIQDDHTDAEPEEEDLEEVHDYNFTATSAALTTLQQFPFEVTTSQSTADHRITERSLEITNYLKAVGLDCDIINGAIVNCSYDKYNDPQQIREVKNTVNGQIKQVKAVLGELKRYHKHLKSKKTPFGETPDFSPTLPTPSNEHMEEEDDEQEEGDSSASEEHHEQPQSTGCSCSAPFGKSNHRKINRDRDLQEEKRRLKEERLRHKERKNKKKAKYLNTTCNAEKMNCFTHDDHHWKTPPLWSYGPFCFCQNANNNTYWCIRTINETHNFLFCEFVTGFLSFYDMTVDPYQMQNIIHDVPLGVLSQLHLQLMKLRECRGAKECTVRNRPHYAHVRAQSGFNSDTYSADIAAARVSKQMSASRQWKHGQGWSAHKRRRQKG